MQRQIPPGRAFSRTAPTLAPILLKSTESDLGYVYVLPIERESHMTIPPARLWSHVQEEDTLRRCDQSPAAAKKTGLGRILDSRRHASAGLIECGSSFSIGGSLDSGAGGS